MSDRQIIHLYHHFDEDQIQRLAHIAGGGEFVRQSLANVTHQLEKIMQSQAQLAQDLKDIGAQVTKIGVESKTTIQRVADLEAAQANSGNTTPEVDAALQALKDQVKVVDDLVADVPQPAA